jgi:hypothetical protein
VSRIVAQLRRRWPWKRILLRDDSGFAGEALMTWCEANRLDFLFGLARNERLEAAIRTELTPANLDSLRTRQGRTAVQGLHVVNTIAASPARRRSPMAGPLPGSLSPH